MLTQGHARKIARKLAACINRGRKHDLVVIKCDGRVVGTFGIQRGSREQSHDYIPRQIGVTMRQAQGLANCPMSREEYCELLSTTITTPT